MDFMLKTVFGKLYNENVPFVYLMPASKKYIPHMDLGECTMLHLLKL